MYSFRISVCTVPRSSFKGILFFSRYDWVPPVAKSSNPIFFKSLAISQIAGLSLSLTLMKTFPVLGKITPAARCALKYASPKLFPIPMISFLDPIKHLLREISKMVKPLL